MVCGQEMKVEEKEAQPPVMTSCPSDLEFKAATIIGSGLEFKLSSSLVSYRFMRHERFAQPMTAISNWHVETGGPDMFGSRANDPRLF